MRAARSGSSQPARQRGALLLSVDPEGFQQRGAVLLSLQPPNCCDHGGTLRHPVRSHTPTHSAGVGFASACERTCRDACALRRSSCRQRGALRRLAVRQKRMETLMQEIRELGRFPRTRETPLYQRLNKAKTQCVSAG